MSKTKEDLHKELDDLIRKMKALYFDLKEADDGTAECNDMMDVIINGIGKIDSYAYTKQTPLPKFEFKKIEGASEHVPFMAEAENDATYDNESGAQLTYCEWWNVTNQGKINQPYKSFRCDSEEDAKWLMGILNAPQHPMIFGGGSGFQIWENGCLVGGGGGNIPGFEIKS